MLLSIHQRGYAITGVTRKHLRIVTRQLDFHPVLSWKCFFFYITQFTGKCLQKLAPAARNLQSTLHGAFWYPTCPHHYRRKQRKVSPKRCMKCSIKRSVFLRMLSTRLSGIHAWNPLKRLVSYSEFLSIPRKLSSPFPSSEITVDCGLLPSFIVRTVEKSVEVTATTLKNQIDLKMVCGMDRFWKNS